MIQNKGDTVIIKGSKFMYVWIFLATVGFLLACIFLIIHGLKFNSKYSFLYLGGGIVLTPFYLYLTIWSLPGLMPGRVLFRIFPGEKGTVNAKKDMVSISNIRSINLVRNPLNLINDIVIDTFNDKKIIIRTYNLLGDLDYEMIVDQYIYPYMPENAKEVWDRKVDLERLRKVARYERKEPKIE
ncbi:DUF5381 family protein [Cytobacillus firmus]|uniref:DUF5381 family protein n=1 Tax=Cytobacillus firmus TaxID=1399 RepID=UPI0024C12441|nr:DUF5381 family protein [Cytobacillus firmus]WHY36630.1 DUF5381 family protein [Cytobacillus firmus]